MVKTPQTVLLLWLFWMLFGLLSAVSAPTPHLRRSYLVFRVKSDVPMLNWLRPSCNITLWSLLTKKLTFATIVGLTASADLPGLGLSLKPILPSLNCETPDIKGWTEPFLQPLKNVASFFFFFFFFFFWFYPLQAGFLLHTTFPPALSPWKR